MKLLGPMRKLLPLLVALALAYVGVSQRQQPAAETVARAIDDNALTQAISQRRSQVQVSGQGTVAKVLPEDRRGSRHQRFLVRLSSGETVLIAHNIDVAARIDALAPGDSIKFKGEYVWNAKGGVVHWTHHAPDGHHAGGWIEHHDRHYE